MDKLTNFLVVGMCIAGVGMASGTFYLVNAAQRLSVVQEDESDLKTYYGFFGELSAETQKQHVTEDHLRLRFSAERPEVLGETTAQMPQKGKTFTRTWKINGYYRDPRLVFNIYTVPSADDPKPPSGIGTVYLTKTEGGDYTGTTLYLDCDLVKVLRCPYAMTSTKMTMDQAQEKWSALFSDDNKCAAVELSPKLKAADLTC